MRALLLALAAALLSVVRAPRPLPTLTSVEPHPRRQRRRQRRQEFQLSSSAVGSPRALIHYVAAQGQLPSTEAKGYYNVGYGRTYY